MKTTRTMQATYANKVYYLPLGNYSQYWDDFTTNKNGEQLFKGCKVLDMYITDNMTYKIVTNEIVPTGFKPVYLKKTYKPVIYNTLEEFINNTYKPVTIGIINSMYCGMRAKKDGSYVPQTNYESVKEIINNHYNDNIIEDLFNTVYITLWINQDTINFKNPDYTIGTITTDINYQMYNSKKDDYEFIKNCNSLYLACYKAVSKELYNHKTKHDKKCIMSLYSTNKVYNYKNGTEISQYRECEYTIDSYGFKQNILDHVSEKAMNNVNDIIHNVMDYIKAMEKPHIYNKCLKVMIELQKGKMLKDIASDLDMSKNSVTKYKNIIVCAYKTITKDYVYNITNYSSNLDEEAQIEKICFDITEKNYHDYDLTTYYNCAAQELFNANITHDKTAVDTLPATHNAICNDKKTHLALYENNYYNTMIEHYNSLLNNGYYDNHSMETCCGCDTLTDNYNNICNKVVASWENENQ